MRENCLQGVVNSKGADQLMCSLISTCVIRLLESIISRLTTSEISDLNVALSETPKTGFLVKKPILIYAQWDDKPQ